MSKFPEEVGQVIEVQIKDHGIKNCKTLMLLLLLLFFKILLLSLLLLLLLFIYLVV